jgi:hypothetical protein
MPIAGRTRRGKVRTARWALSQNHRRGYRFPDLGGPLDVNLRAATVYIYRPPLLHPTGTALAAKHETGAGVTQRTNSPGASP